MKNRKSTARPRTPIVVGTGLIALDVVYVNDPFEPIGRWAGGTCGNVMLILSYLGWKAYPIARLKNDPESERIVEDFVRWNVNLDFVDRSENGSTPVIIEYLKQHESGDVSHRFSMRCPLCGNRLPNYRAPTISMASEMVPRLPEPSVFFFDRTSRAALNLAEQCKNNGAIVVFEPSGIGDPRLFKEALATCHILKYADDRLGTKDEVANAADPLLVIETRGDEGLRVKTRLANYHQETWKCFTPHATGMIRDAAGAGDWCTAGLIHELASRGIDGLVQLTEDDLARTIGYAQALAAWSCAFEGPRGGMYQVERAQMDRQIAKMISGLQPSDFCDDYDRPSDHLDRHLCSVCRNGETDLPKNLCSGT